MNKFSLVLIDWVDSRQINGWTHKSDIDDGVCRIQSCGFLIKETENDYTLAVSVGDTHLADYQASGIVIIPKCAVLEIDYLNDLNDD